MFSKNTPLHASVPLSKRLTIAKEPGARKPGEELTATEMGRTALKAVINLVEISQCEDLPQLLEHRVVEECMSLFNSDGIYRKTQKSKITKKFSLQSIDLHKPYVAVVDMDMIWSMAAPTAEDRQMEDGTPYNWSDYVQKVSSVIIARHGDTDRIICVNDPYDAAYSTKDDERDLRVQGNAHVPNTYMNLADPSPVPERSKRCRVSNKGQLQKLICNYLTDLAQSVDAETIYSVGPHSTSVSIQQPMQNGNFDQSQADTVLFSAFAVLRESGCTGPVVIDAVDADAYVVAAVLWQKLAGMICIKRKQETIFCRGLLADEMADCVVQLHCMTGCDVNSGFYGKGKKLVYDQVAKNPVARRCGESLDLEEEEVEQFTRHVIFGDKSSTIAEARVAKWKRMNNK